MSAVQKSGPDRRKLMVLAAVAAVLLVLAWYANNYVSLEQLAQQELRIRNLIAIDPPRAFLVGFAVYLALALVPGTGGKAIVYGWLFGFWQAIFIVSVGLTIAAMVIFALSRYLVRDSIERRYASFLSIMNRHLKKEGAFYLLTLRMAHAPYSIVNPVSGASRVAGWTFLWTTALGLLPANAIWIYVGISLPSLHELAIQGPNAFISTPLIVALFGCAALPLLIRWLLGLLGAIAPIREAEQAELEDSQGGTL